MASSNPLDVLASHADKPFSFENQFLRSSVIAFMPIQANASATEVDDSSTGGKRQMSWYQLIGQFKSAYSANSETGEAMKDNATVKTMKIKFPPECTENITASRFKEFMDAHFVGKKSITLPIVSESPSFDRQNGKSTPVKNSVDILVDPSFKLVDYIHDVENKSKANEKKPAAL